MRERYHQIQYSFHYDGVLGVFAATWRGPNTTDSPKEGQNWRISKSRLPIRCEILILVTLQIW